MQHRLKPKARAAWARIIAAKLLDQLLASVHDTVAAFDLRFRRETLATLARYLKTSVGRGGSCMYAWHTSKSKPRRPGLADCMGTLAICLQLVFVPDNS